MWFLDVNETYIINQQYFFRKEGFNFAQTVSMSREPFSSALVTLNPHISALQCIVLQIYNVTDSQFLIAVPCAFVHADSSFHYVSC